jgi:hypothetical protein
MMPIVMTQTANHLSQRCVGRNRRLAPMLHDLCVNVAHNVIVTSEVMLECERLRTALRAARCVDRVWWKRYSSCWELDRHLSGTNPEGDPGDIDFEDALLLSDRDLRALDIRLYRKYSRQERLVMLQQLSEHVARCPKCGMLRKRKQYWLRLNQVAWQALEKVQL